jgi:RHS repeat-associated protein
LGLYTTAPFGEPISGQITPTNTVPNGTYSFAGQHQKLTETSFTLTPIHMGARIYLPTLGRFTQVDPVEGGTPNSYVYVVDPVNGNDFSGLLGVINSSSNAVITVIYNYGMQPTAAVPRPAPPTIQATASAARTQGPGSMRSNAGRTAAPAKLTTPSDAAGFIFKNVEAENARRAAPMPSPQTTQLAVSFCAYICGQAGLAYDGNGLPHLSVGYALGLSAGVGVTVGGGPGKVNTGANMDLNCTWGPIMGGVSSDGSSSGTSPYGGINFAVAKFGCSSGPSYTW